LLEFATKGYETMLAATEELKSMVDPPKKTQTRQPEQKTARASGPRKPSWAP
jgi:hypothetical protein